MIIIRKDRVGGESASLWAVPRCEQTHASFTSDCSTGLKFKDTIWCIRRNHIYAVEPEPSRSNSVQQQLQSHTHIYSQSCFWWASKSNLKLAKTSQSLGSLHLSIMLVLALKLVGWPGWQSVLQHRPDWSDENTKRGFILLAPAAALRWHWYYGNSWKDHKHSVLFSKFIFSNIFYICAFTELHHYFFSSATRI